MTEIRETRVTSLVPADRAVEMRGLIALTAFRNGILVDFDEPPMTQQEAGINYTEPTTLSDGEVVNMFTTHLVEGFGAARNYKVGRNRLGGAFNALARVHFRDDFPVHEVETIGRRGNVKTDFGIMPEHMGVILDAYRCHDGTYVGVSRSVGNGLMQIFEHLYVEQMVITTGNMPTPPKLNR